MTMRLGTRLTCYLLAGMALVLVGFSIALYAMAAEHLYRQADERLESALNTLAAAAETGPDGVEWEPEERSLSFGRRTLEGRFSWRVGDVRGTRIDGSSAGKIDNILARHGSDNRPKWQSESSRDESGIAWRTMTLRLDRQRAEGDVPSPVSLSPGRHDALVLGAATSMEGVAATLRNLALTLGCLSTATWVLALAFGRRLCRIALRPLTDMAEAAHAIGGGDPDQRLPTPATDDELEELGSSFNALLDRLGESLGRQQRFTGDASHQLRTPLTVILGQVEVALRQDRPPEEYRRVLSLVRSRTRHLCQIVEGLMFLSRAEAEARRPEMERIALDDWLCDHLDAWPNSRRPDLDYDHSKFVHCQVRVHPPLLGELVDNLLDNAAKYGPSGTPIRIRLEPNDGEVSLSISDLGPGIDRADLPHVFEPFFRAEAARARGSAGFGLGLSVAARIAAVFGGSIMAHSTFGSGATFTLHLPLVDNLKDGS